MTTQKERQFHDRNGDSVALARRLRCAGCPLEFDENGLESTPKGLRIIQIDNPLENSIFDLNSGGAGYILCVEICNDTERPVRIEQFRLEPPWADPDFHWLEDPYRSVPRQDYYSVPSSALSIERTTVLNHRTGRNGKLLPLDTKEGLLLAVGSRPIPDHYVPRFKLQTTLTIVDGRGNMYPSKVWLWGERNLKRIRQRAEAESRQRLRLPKVMPRDPDPAESDVISETTRSAICGY